MSEERTLEEIKAEISRERALSLRLKAERLVLEARYVEVNRAWRDASRELNENRRLLDESASRIGSLSAERKFLGAPGNAEATPKHRTRIGTVFPGGGADPGNGVLPTNPGESE